MLSRSSKHTLHTVFSPFPDTYPKVCPASLVPCRQLPCITPYTWTEPPRLSALGCYSDTLAPLKLLVLDTPKVSIVLPSLMYTRAQLPLISFPSPVDSHLRAKPNSDHNLYLGLCCFRLAPGYTTTEHPQEASNPNSSRSIYQFPPSSMGSRVLKTKMTYLV